MIIEVRFHLYISFTSSSIHLHGPPLLILLINIIWHFPLIGASSMSVEEDNEAAEDDDVESLICTGCAEEKDSCHCTKIIEVFSQFNSQLHSLGLMKKVAEPAFLSVIHREVLHALYCACTLHIVEAFRGRSSGWIGWLPSPPSHLWGRLSLKLRKRTKLSPR